MATLGHHNQQSNYIITKVGRLQKINDVYSAGLLTEGSDNNFLTEGSESIILARDKLTMIMTISAERTYNQTA